MRSFQAGETICDYHAPQISEAEAEGIVHSEEACDRRSDYLFSAYVTTHGWIYWDASAESCACHPQTRVLGRLINFAENGSHACNTRPTLCVFGSKKTDAELIFVATRDISVLEEVCYDYGDKKCRELFL